MWLAGTWHVEYQERYESVRAGCVRVRMRMAIVESARLCARVRACSVRVQASEQCVRVF